MKVILISRDLTPSPWNNSHKVAESVSMNQPWVGLEWGGGREMVLADVRLTVIFDIHSNFEGGCTFNEV